MNAQQKISHLLIMIPGFPEDEQDTTCLPTVQQFIFCYRKKYPETEISIISLHYPFNKKKYKWHGINVYPFRGRNKPGLTGRGFIILKTILFGLRLNRSKKVDAVLSLWLADSAFAGKWIAKFLKIPHLIWMQGQDAKPGNYYFSRIRAGAEDIAAMSEFQNNIFKESYGMEAGYVIHNGINTGIFPALNTGERPIDLYGAGYLTTVKRYDLFVEVVKFLKDSGKPNVKVILSGSGQQELAIKELIEQYGLSDNITLTGKVSHTEVLEYMNKAKVFVHTSEYEGGGAVLFEALYSGCHVVSFIPVQPEMKNYTACTSIEQMKTTCLQLLLQPLQLDRVLFNNMDESVMKVHSILLSKQIA